MPTYAEVIDALAASGPVEVFCAECGWTEGFSTYGDFLVKSSRAHSDAAGYARCPDCDSKAALRPERGPQVLHEGIHAEAPRARESGEGRMSEADGPTCGTCRFYHKQACRRYPPTMPGHLGGISAFPGVRHDAWCGEYERAPPARDHKFHGAPRRPQPSDFSWGSI